MGKHKETCQQRIIPISLLIATILSYSVIPTLGASVEGIEIPSASLLAAFAGIVVIVGVIMVAAYFTGHTDNTIVALLGVGLVSVVVVFAIMVPFLGTIFAGEVSPIPPPIPTPTPAGRVSLTDPLRITLVDAIQRTTVASATETVEIWKPDSFTYYEVLDGFDSDAVDDSSYEYTSGESLILVWDDGSNGRYAKNIVVPYGQSETDLERGYIPINFEIVPFPTSHSSFVQLPNGTTYSSDISLGSAWVTANPKPTIYFQARITSDNTGFLAYEEPDDPDYPYREVIFYLVVSVSTGNRPSITGIPRVFSDSTKDIYAISLNKLQRVVKPNGQVLEQGSVEASITIDFNPVSSTATVTFAWTLSYHDNRDYLSTYGSSITGAVTYDSVDMTVTK